MKVTVIENGVIKIVCVPVTAIDREAVQAFKNKTLKATYMPQPTTILDVPAPDALILTIVEDVPVDKTPQEVYILLSPDNTYVGIIAVNDEKSIITKVENAIVSWLQRTDIEIKQENPQTVNVITGINDEGLTCDSIKVSLLRVTPT